MACRERGPVPGWRGGVLVWVGVVLLQVSPHRLVSLLAVLSSYADSANFRVRGHRKVGFLTVSVHRLVPGLQRSIRERGVAPTVQGPGHLPDPGRGSAGVEGGEKVLPGPSLLPLDNSLRLQPSGVVDVRRLRVTRVILQVSPCCSEVVQSLLAAGLPPALRLRQRPPGDGLGGSVEAGDPVGGRLL